MQRFLSSLALALSFAGLRQSVYSAPILNEIMFHTSDVPENVAKEWIEIHNPDAAGVSLAGWRIDKGVDFTFPAGTSIPANGYLVVAANTAEFSAANPGVTNVVGGWTGKLSNSGERVRLVNAAGTEMDQVDYANEGDWGTRARGPLLFSHRGWIWESTADGGGNSLELINPAIHQNSGQNWKPSADVGGTPGAANSVLAANTAPLIENVKHRPEIPKSTDPIVISADVTDEGITVSPTLNWRLDAGTWQTIPMLDSDGDGSPDATIPAQANLAIVEFYISATDGTLARTWPAPARTSDIGVLPETFGQVTNALIQVDNSFDPAADFTLSTNQPLYRFIMTAAEKAELATIGSVSGQEDSDAEMNTTFISQDGRGVSVRYLASTRNRGTASRLGPPNNYYLGLRSDDPWDGRTSFQFNCQFPHSQVLGALLVQQSGIAVQEATPVRLRVNGVDLAQAGSLMYGRYARIEPANGNWAKNHFPNDADGNVYSLDDHAYPQGDNRSGEFRYEGTDPAAYSDTYLKKTNEEENDYSDLIELTKVISAPATSGTAAQPAIADADYVAALATKVNIDQWLTWFASDALVGNQEGGLQSGRCDDVSMYRGVLDPRFILVPHDFDDVFNIGSGVGNPVTRSIFSYDYTSGGTTPGTGNLGLARFFSHPEIVQRYYANVLTQCDTWFNRATLDPLIDRLIGGWVPAGTVTTIKGFIDSRRDQILGNTGLGITAQIQQVYAMTVTTAGTAIEGLKRTTDGSATISGTFNVAKTGSILVNGMAAQIFHRTSGSDVAGSWKMIVPAGGGSVLHPGRNRVVVEFWSGKNGTGTLVQTLTEDVIYQGTVATYTNVSGTLTSGSLRLTAPSTFIPGKPFLVRADVLDAAGNVDRSAWDGTVALNASVSGIVLPSIQIFNGTGSALVTAGGASGLPPTVLMSYGTGGTGANGSGVSGSAWKVKSDFTTASLTTFMSTVGDTWRDESFDATSWTSVNTQAGYGNSDENSLITRVDYDTTTTGVQNVPCYLFRSTITIPDVSAITNVTGQIKYDDAYAIYVNGVDILQRTASLPAGRALNLYATTTSADNATAAVTIPASYFHNGVNTIAVDVRQGSATSGDVTFDLRLQANYPAADPGNFTLTGTYTGPGATLSANKSLTSLTTTPAMTTVAASTTLPAGVTTWSGVMDVQGNVTVPAGAILNIAAGTHVLMAGNATPGSTTGALITVAGTLNSNGTFAQPVTIGAFNAGDYWGGIFFNAAQPSSMNYTLLNHAGHTTGQGHTGRGPMIRLAGSSLNLDDSVLADGPAKAMYTTGTLDLNIRRSLIERMVTGPELGDGAAMLCEDSNIQRILPDFRESNAATPDDEDCMYIHNGANRSVIMRRSVFARCGDDVFDGLAGPLVVEDSILREGWDKGMSLLNNDLTITRTMIINCDKAIVPKSQNADTRSVVATNCTIVSENHDTTLAPWGYSVPPSSPDADSPSTGFYTQNKSGQSNTGATLSIVAKNCIVIAQAPVLVDAPYSAANSVVTYSDLALLDYSNFTWPGTGNISANPLFANTASGNYRITATSPARDAGDPATTDPDSTVADMGALYFGGGTASGGIINWTAANGPYRVTANTTVPVGTTLNIGPGTCVYFDRNTRLSVQGGRINAQGTAGQRITFSHVPGTVVAGDCDPIKLLTQTGAPKWGGIRIFDSMAQENIIRYADFINAQGTDPATSENEGSLGFIRSKGWADNLTFAGTHLRMLYGRNCALTVTYCTFPDMFIFDPVLNRIEEPTTDFLSVADNRMEPMKVEHPLGSAGTNPELVGLDGAAGTFPNGLPRNGHFRIYFNSFHGNRGHQDVFDADSGRWAALDASGFQTNGQFVLDCRYNHFFGQAGDEHIDLGGDAYIASNIFEAGRKDFWTNDTGYSNAISSGDKGTGTTIMVARNTCYDLDHVINCKASTATIFEHNTVANLHADFNFVGSTVTQNVKCAPVNIYISGDGGSPSYGDGAYMGFNIISNVPRLLSGADTRDSDPSGAINDVHDVTTQIQFQHNLLDQITDPVVGSNHPGGYFSGTYGPNEAGLPGFVNPAAEDYTLSPTSPAKGRTPHGFDYGADIDEWAYIVDGPVGSTADSSANFIVGGPGLVSYKWRLDGGAWSAAIQIGSGGLLPRGSATVRQATIALTGLSVGPHTLEVLGQDMAGNWQDADAARAYDAQPQALPTSHSWTVSPAPLPLVINEVMADNVTAHNNGGTFPDYVEIYNPNASAVSLAGWMLSDNPAKLNKYTFSAATNIAAGAYLVVYLDAPAITPGLHASFSLKAEEGEAVYLSQSGVVKDSIIFGRQIADYSIGRLGPAKTWDLNIPTPAAANTPANQGDPAGLRINEWLASSNIRFNEDWIELANPSALPVSLAGISLTDIIADPSVRYSFPSLSFIGPSEFAKFIADGDAAAGANHLDLKLGEFTDELAIYQGTTQLQRIHLEPQTSDISQGLVSFGGLGGLDYFVLPTDTLANGTGNPAYANALAILNGLRITEIMYHHPLGTNLQYVELTNTGATTLDLSGISFTDGIDFTFPVGFTLAAGAQCVIVSNAAVFTARYGSSVVVAGQFTGNLANSGEVLTLQLAPPFSANILNFDFGGQWYAPADGGGTALLLASLSTPINRFDNRASWTVSVDGGNPAGLTTQAPPQTSFPTWLNYYGGILDVNDEDFDGLNNLMEYGYGTNVSISSPHMLPAANVSGDQHLLMNLTLPASVLPGGVGLPDIKYIVEAGSDLTGWTSIAEKTPASASWTGTATVTVGPTASGRVTLTVKDPEIISTRRFLKLRVELIP